MKRLLLTVCALFLFTALPAEAQPTWRHQLYFNSGPQFVMGDQSDAYKTGLAIDAGYYYRASRAGFVGIAGGYHQFKGKGAVGDLNVIPVHLALKYNFSLTGVQPYIGGEVGPYFLSNGSSETKFGAVPRLGLRIPLAEGIDLDVNVKYNIIFQDSENFTYVGTNGGFSYIVQ
ncbi:hypothetical protein BSZ35_05175 [Salinibacter sp. 10B]|uniref:outer membrane beta-barrel protein n=1 Tax=Salinibacter sp. 10B TaxID=1923971 RepID=UPI000D28C51F|nr:outer membrane beta-barrel protein [Salinibacter sp. 10B]PQJ34078.1 hypothetical protein BSZ35_05175 [Salinibacter sp. 10B]